MTPAQLLCYPVPWRDRPDDGLQAFVHRPVAGGDDTMTQAALTRFAPLPLLLAIGLDLSERQGDLIKGDPAGSGFQSRVVVLELVQWDGVVDPKATDLEAAQLREVRR